VYDTAGTSINAVSIILLGGENISFDASHVMYVNSALGALFQMYLELEVMKDNHTWCGVTNLESGSLNCIKVFYDIPLDRLRNTTKHYFPSPTFLYFISILYFSLSF